MTRGPERTKRKAAAPSGGGAKYRLTQDGYFPGYGYAVKDTELFFDGIPGKHMQPLNSAAEKAYNDMAKAKGLPTLGAPATEPASVRVTEVPPSPGAPPTDQEKALELAKQMEAAEAAAKAEKAKPKAV